MPVASEVHDQQLAETSGFAMGNLLRNPFTFVARFVLVKLFTPWGLLLLSEWAWAPICRETTGTMNPDLLREDSDGVMRKREGARGHSGGG